MNPTIHFHPHLPPATQPALTALLAAALETTEAEVAADLRYQQQRQPVQAWLAYFPDYTQSMARDAAESR